MATASTRAHLAARTIIITIRSRSCNRCRYADTHTRTPLVSSVSNLNCKHRYAIYHARLHHAPHMSATMCSRRSSAQIQGKYLSDAIARVLSPPIYVVPEKPRPRICVCVYTYTDTHVQDRPRVDPNMFAQLFPGVAHRSRLDRSPTASPLTCQWLSLYSLCMARMLARSLYVYER